MNPVAIIAFCACAAGALLAVRRVQDRSLEAAFAFTIEKTVGAVGLRIWTASWGYMAVALLLAGAAGWIARGL